MTSMRTHRILQGSSLFAESGYFILRDHYRQPLAYLSFEDEPGGAAKELRPTSQSCPRC
jgi:hypothetical protein